MTTNENTPELPPHSPFSTVLLHGARFRAVPAQLDQAYTHDILVDLPGGGHVASVTGFEAYGESCAQTEEHVSVLTASAQMLTALVDMLNARGARPSTAMGGGRTGRVRRLRHARDRCPLHPGPGWPVHPPRWAHGMPAPRARPGTSPGTGYDASRRVVMLLTSETEVEIAISLERAAAVLPAGGGRERIGEGGERLPHARSGRTTVKGDASRCAGLALPRAQGRAVASRSGDAGRKGCSGGHPHEIATSTRRLVRQLLDHSKAATERSPSYDQLYEGRFRRDGKDVHLDSIGSDNFPTADDVDPDQDPGRLVAGGRDQGVYLMSNGKPPLLVDPADTRHVVAHAPPKRTPAPA